MANDLIEYNTYSKGTSFTIAIFMLIAPVINFVMIPIHKNILWVSIELIVLGYALPCFILYKFIDEKISVKATHDFLGTDRNKKIISALVLGLIVGAIVGALLILYAAFIGWGPSAIHLFLPWYNSSMDYFIWFLFILIWVLLLSDFETFFYFLFEASCFNASWTDFFIAACYALMNLSWLVYVIEKFWAIVILTIISFGIGIALLKIRDRQGGLQAVGVRLGLAIGIFALLVYLENYHHKAKSPTYYYRGRWW